MPRIRTIKPKFWDDIKLSKISRDARLLFIGIWNFSDDLGVIVAEPLMIKSKVFPYDKLDLAEFEKWLTELVDKKFIIPITFNEELFFYIRTFNRHQRIDKPNHEDICIDKEALMQIIDKSTINRRLIEERSKNDRLSIDYQSKEEGKGKEGNNKGIIREGKGIPENFSLTKIYSKKYEDLNGAFKDLSEQGFLNWKKFVDFIIKKNFCEIFDCKFVNPQDFEKLDFPESKWEQTLKAILATGVKPEHNLFFRIPQFLEYSKPKHGKRTSEVGRTLKFDKP